MTVFDQFTILSCSNSPNKEKYLFESTHEQNNHHEKEEVVLDDENLKNETINILKLPKNQKPHQQILSYKEDNNNLGIVSLLTKRKCMTLDNSSGSKQGADELSLSDVKPVQSKEKTYLDSGKIISTSSHVKLFKYYKDLTINTEEGAEFPFGRNKKKLYDIDFFLKQIGCTNIYFNPQLIDHIVINCKRLPVNSNILCQDNLSLKSQKTKIAENYNI